MNLTYQQFENIMVTAIEGGINYWGSTETIRDINGKTLQPMIMMPYSCGVAHTLYNHKDSEVDIFDIEECEVIGTLSFGKVEKVIEDDVLYNLKEKVLNETYDAETADIIVQLASMGDIVFG